MKMNKRSSQPARNSTASKVITLATVASSLLLSQSIRAAEDITWLVGIEPAVRNLEFEQSFATTELTTDNGTTLTPTKTRTDYDVSLMEIGFTVGAVWSDFSLILNHSTNLSEEDEDIDISLNSVKSSTKASFDREDTTITLGWSIMDGVSVFTGYKYGETTTDGDGVNFKETFEEDGPFVGASYSIPFEAGNLTFSAAYASMDGDFKSNQEIEILTGLVNITQNSLKYKGDTTGLSFGASWSGELTDNMIYTVSLKHQKYDFDSKAQVTRTVEYDPLLGFTTDILTGSAKVKNEETMTSFGVGISYIF